MFRKILLGLFTLSVLTGCGQNYDVTPVSAPQDINVSEHEPNYISTLNAQGEQTSDLKNIYRFGKVNEFLYRGGLPTDADLQALKQNNFKSVISFRGLGDPTEAAQVAQEKATVTGLKMKFFNIQVPFDKPVPDKIIKQFFDTVNNPKNQPLFVHCKGGRDRTGTLVALYRIKFNRYTPQQAIEEMKTFTFEPVNYPIFTNQILNFKP